MNVRWRAAAARGVASMALLTLLQTAPAGDRDRGTRDDSLDDTRSRATFSVKLMLVVGIEGRFRRLRGDIERNAFRDEISVDAHIDATSVTMSNHFYDDWVRSSEFFDVDRYPDIDFAAEPIPAMRLRSGGNMPGMLTLRGIRKPVTFTLEAASCDRPGVDCPIKVRGSVQRSEFEMRSRRGALGDKVQLVFDVFIKTPPTAR